MNRHRTCPAACTGSAAFDSCQPCQLCGHLHCPACAPGPTGPLCRLYIAVAGAPTIDQPIWKGVPELRKVTIYHNDECRFMPYKDRQLLIAVTSHWLDDAVAVNDAQAVADWAFHVFNADLDMLEPSRDTAGGETTFLAACVYRLLGYRSLSVGDVIEVTSGDDTVWLACESFGWRAIAEPTNRSGQALTAAAVYQSMAARRSTR